CRTLGGGFGHAALGRYCPSIFLQPSCTARILDLNPRSSTPDFSHVLISEQEKESPKEGSVTDNKRHTGTQRCALLFHGVASAFSGHELNPQRWEWHGLRREALAPSKS